MKIGNWTCSEQYSLNEIEARTIPQALAICPICGKGLWIESIDEASEEGGRLIPQQVTVTCETEPNIDSREWNDWHREHFAAPYIDWLPVADRVLKWLQQPEQRQRFEAIWNSGRAMLP